jgi:hypothetical protein
MEFTIIFKIHRMSLKSHFLFYLLKHVSASQGHHQATIIDRNNHTIWGDTSIYLYAIFTFRRIREYTAAFSSCYFRVAAFPLCSFVRSALRGRNTLQQIK